MRSFAILLLFIGCLQNEAFTTVLKTTTKRTTRINQLRTPDEEGGAPLPRRQRMRQAFQRSRAKVSRRINIVLVSVGFFMARPVVEPAAAAAKIAPAPATTKKQQAAEILEDMKAKVKENKKGIAVAVGAGTTIVLVKKRSNKIKDNDPDNDSNETEGGGVLESNLEGLNAEAQTIAEEKPVVENDEEEDIVEAPIEENTLVESKVEEETKEDDQDPPLFKFLDTIADNPGVFFGSIAYGLGFAVFQDTFVGLLAGSAVLNAFQENKGTQGPLPPASTSTAAEPTTTTLEPTSSTVPPVDVSSPILGTGVKVDDDPEDDDQAMSQMIEQVVTQDSPPTSMGNLNYPLPPKEEFQRNLLAARLELERAKAVKEVAAAKTAEAARLEKEAQEEKILKQQLEVLRLELVARLEAEDQKAAAETTAALEAQQNEKEVAEEEKTMGSTPKMPKQDGELQQKYASIDSIEDRAYQVLLDLGMVGKDKE